MIAHVNESTHRSKAPRSNGRARHRTDSAFNPADTARPFALRLIALLQERGAYHAAAAVSIREIAQLCGGDIQNAEFIIERSANAEFAIVPVMNQHTRAGIFTHYFICDSADEIDRYVRSLESLGETVLQMSSYYRTAADRMRSSQRVWLDQSHPDGNRGDADRTNDVSAAGASKTD